MADALTNLHSRLNSWLVAPLSGWWCVLGWCAATALFVGIVALLGGPSFIDTPESVYGTWAVAHGQMACAYPPVNLPDYPPTAPVYLLLSGGIAAIARIGHAVPFPSAATLGPGCDRAFVAMGHWSPEARAFGPTTWIGCVGWLALLIGVVAYLRASGRGRCGWEPATILIVASLPPVWLCVEGYFHPQDLLAMGLALSALACARRGGWVAAGILVALAVLSQQFALLVAAPLFLLAPANRRISYAGAALATGAIVVFSFVTWTSGHALRAITLGTGDNPVPGGTIAWELHLNGAPFVLLTRVAPIAVSMVLAWWVSRRLGPIALQAATLMSIMAVSLGLRLVFEQLLVAYYFMALAVSLVLLDVVRGHLRRSVVAWLAAVAVVFCFFGGQAFNQVTWGGYLRRIVPLLIVAIALLLTLHGVLRGRTRRDLLPWVAVAVCALLMWSGHINTTNHRLLVWFWQLALVVPGVVLAAGPLLAEMRRYGTRRDPQSVLTVASPD
jgi:hypothetical protein